MRGRRILAWIVYAIGVVLAAPPLLLALVGMALIELSIPLSGDRNMRGPLNVDWRRR